ncbi:hypothetical protein MWH06_01280 [Wolbachia pipientis]|nr:hypothetical protein MWH06_01280 [Wolbachia pipientis]
MVFIINGECDMALSDSLKNKTEQQLVDDDAFINALVGKLKAGADDNGVYTKKGVNDELGKKADTTALATKVEKTYVDTELGKKADTTALATKVEKTYVDTELGKKADTTALATKADKTYVDTELGKKANSADLAAKANTADVYTKKNVDDELAKKADTAALADKADKTYVDTELGKKANSADLAAKANAADVYTKATADIAFAKIDGSNATDPGVTAMLGKLIDANKVLKVDGSNATDPGVTAMLGKLTDKVVKTSELSAKAAEKEVVEAIFDAIDGGNKISETKIGTTFAKKNASNLTDAANKKAFAEAILPAKDGNKSILVDKLEGFLAENAKAYSNTTKTAKELLVPSAADLLQDHDFKQGIDQSIKEMAVSSNSDSQKNVREVMSQPHFDIPASDDAALNWTW